MSWKSRKAKLMCKTGGSRDGTHTAAFCPGLAQAALRACGNAFPWTYTKARGAWSWQTCSGWPCWSKEFEWNDLQRCLNHCVIQMLHKKNPYFFINLYYLLTSPTNKLEKSYFPDLIPLKSKFEIEYWKRQKPWNNTVKEETLPCNQNTISQLSTAPQALTLCSQGPTCCKLTQESPEEAAWIHSTQLTLSHWKIFLDCKHKITDFRRKNHLHIWSKLELHLKSKFWNCSAFKYLY